ncbi:unnamed protein product [Paramecium octaurelia]|uniref:Uncharacterized protein n=1 Tax=Paramecium octaurelia TaxID=43137 RepID=A0A8S1YIX7_PAROT|nr:unnamed protein product [Paramecium octaurelia]
MENFEILLSLDYWRGQRFGEQRLPKQNIRDQETQICGFDIDTCFSKKLHFNKFLPLKKVLLEQPDKINRDIRISQFSFASIVLFQKCQHFWQEKINCVEQQKAKKQYSQMIIQNKLRFETRFTVHLILLSRILNLRELKPFQKFFQNYYDEHLLQSLQLKLLFRKSSSYKYQQNQMITKQHSLYLRRHLGCVQNYFIIVGMQVVRQKRTNRCLNVEAFRKTRNRLNRIYGWLNSIQIEFNI